MKLHSLRTIRKQFTTNAAMADAMQCEYDFMNIALRRDRQIDSEGRIWRPSPSPKLMIDGVDL
jgi:hypothetical protein